MYFMMIYRKALQFIGLILFFAFTCCHANSAQVDPFQHPFYVGGVVGYGSTTWNGLVPSQEHLNSAISLSTPISVKEGGIIWGGIAGYEWTPYFAIEASYIHYPDADITFDPISLFSFTNDGLTQFVAHTETFNLMGKIMLIIPNTKMRIYSSAGIADVHRKDIFTDRWRLSPTFGVGINYHLTDALIGEIGGNYTTGYAESQLNPTQSYIPFLYSISLRLAYSF